MSVQFGMAIMRLDSVTLGYMQSITLDFNFESAQLYGGSNIYPVDIRTHTGSISGSAEYASLNAIGVEKLLGGTRTGSSIAISSTSYPGTFQVIIQMTTDSDTFRIDLNTVKSNKLSFSWARENYIIPNFDFFAVADSSGNVGTVTIEEVS